MLLNDAKPDLLKDESSEIDLVSPTLPALKSLLDVPVARANEAEKGRYSSVIHALLSACLLNIDNMRWADNPAMKSGTFLIQYHHCRGRAGAISTKKIKNNMLAAVLVLTIVPSWVRVGRAVVEHACFLISQKLADSDQVCFMRPSCKSRTHMRGTDLIDGVTLCEDPRPRVGVWEQPYTPPMCQAVDPWSD